MHLSSLINYVKVTIFKRLEVYFNMILQNLIKGLLFSRLKGMNMNTYLIINIVSTSEYYNN